MSDGADSDRDLPPASHHANAHADAPRHPEDPWAAKDDDEDEEDPPAPDEFQDAPLSPETNSDGDGAGSPDRADLPNAGEAAPPYAGGGGVGMRVETNGEDAMSHDADGEDDDDDEDEDDEEDDEEDEDEDDSTPDASPKAEGDIPAGMAQCAGPPAESDPFLDGHDSGTEDEQAAFMAELDRFHRDRSLEFKPPKFYGKGLNCLKLWRQVAHLGGHEQVTICKLWRQVGETFRPPKTCTTVSWSFRIFYEKALLEYEKHKVRTGQLKISVPAIPQPGGTNRETETNTTRNKLCSYTSKEQMIGVNPSSSARIRRDAAARAMQGWHAHRLLANDMYGDHILKDKDSIAFSSRDNRNLKGFGMLHREDSMVIDVGEPADWVKINVRQTKECFEIYALVPGLLREEVHVQSDPAGRLVITGDPDQPDNPWGITAFKKVINLPLRIDPHQTSAVVTLHGQLFVRAPFGHPDM
ncbi:AT-rich interactive domain-containing protein 5-like [Lolium rigidum]|uniref:AT-rich interactive domain-containing protein 5-like n=1 Tax=Lolium rigidum TaxID=89674 RepID=UPI001F5CDBA7|nr:AT-rich interactive domain-containing protein 5-like [Lolium rigidum]